MEKEKTKLSLFPISDVWEEYDVEDRSPIILYDKYFKYSFYNGNYQRHDLKANHSTYYYRKNSTVLSIVQFISFIEKLKDEIKKYEIIVNKEPGNGRYLDYLNEELFKFEDKLVTLEKSNFYTCVIRDALSGDNWRSKYFYLSNDDYEIL